MKIARIGGIAIAALLISVPVAMADGFDGGELFRKACGTCHSAEKDAALRQGPNLFGVYGRKAGTYPGFAYTAGFAAGSKNIVWDKASLDRWLTDPQAMIPGAAMLYKQANPERRAAVIDYLMTVK